jgi:transposase InsO family protein
MSRVGHCIDNGPTEGFWGIIKAEMYYLHKFEDERGCGQNLGLSR